MSLQTALQSGKHSLLHDSPMRRKSFPEGLIGIPEVEIRKFGQESFT
jgi:hypothetical protein